MVARASSSSSSSLGSSPASQTRVTTPKRTTTMQASETSPSKTTPRKNGNASNVSSPKLRRKVTMGECMENVASIQRLVEYFVVISCQRQENTQSLEDSKHNSPPPSPDPNRVEIQRGVPASILASSKSSTGSKRRLRRKRSVFQKATAAADPAKRAAANSIERGLEATLALDSHQDESREEIMAAPKPRGTWTRDDNDDHDDGNIRLPQNENDGYSFQPRISARFPMTDHVDNPLNPMVTHFCHPVTDVVVPTPVFQMPRVHHFVLTNDKGRKMYGTCLTIYEEYEPPSNAPVRMACVRSESGERDIEVTMGEEVPTWYLPRCLCILSFWPYIKAFREYLAQLYRLATSTNCMAVPIERYIINLCLEVPAPPPGAFEVQINILDSVIRFWSPPANLPIAYVALPYQVLFECLDVKNILHLWYCLTLEQKVVLVSSQHSNLTVCAEILCSLLYPLKWSHLYVPLLPRVLAPMLDAPVPFLCGVTRDNWLHVQQFISDDTIVVDLDRNNVMFGAQTPELPALPGKKWKKLRNSLEEIAGHLFWRTRGLEREYRGFLNRKLNIDEFKGAARRKGEIRWNERLEQFDQAFNLQFTPDSENLDLAFDNDQNQWDKVQEAFLRFYVATMKDYRKFLHFPGDSRAQSAPKSREWLDVAQRRSFDRVNFLASQKTEYKAFLSWLTSTQQFDDFITKRLYSPDTPDIIFFDQSIDAKLNRSRLKLRKVDTPFLQSAKVHKVLKKFLAVEPSDADLDIETPIVYKCWPETLDPALFCKPRPIPSIITAEFDRQAALAARLKMASESSCGIEQGNELLDLYYGDYDTNPEGMAFTIFFYTYSAIIGKEWQAFKEKQAQIQTLTEVDNVAEYLDNTHRVENAASGENIEVETSSTTNSAIADLTFGLCDSCPEGRDYVDKAIARVANAPCARPWGNHTNSTYDAISNYANASLSHIHENPSSLLDDEKVFAEYEEARHVAKAQLDLAFDALGLMESRELCSDPDIFKSLMDACGRCGDAKRALNLIQTMQRDGLVADQEVLSCFMTAFANTGASSTTVPQKPTQSQGPDAYSSFLEKKLELLSGGLTKESTQTSRISDSEIESCLSDVLSSNGSDLSSVPSSPNRHQSTLFDWFTSTPRVKKSPKRKKRRRRRNHNMATTELPAVTDRLSKQILLGNSLIEYLFPDLKIETNIDSCPRCSKSMNEGEIIKGWQPRAFQDFTTCCPTCRHRFVPQFLVSCSAPNFEGSQGAGTPLYCEFLSPWVLRKELSRFLDSERGVDVLLDPEWRKGGQIGATLWWNLLFLFRHYELPFSFLLQGSFSNRLISPGPQD